MSCLHSGNKQWQICLCNPAFFKHKPTSVWILKTKATHRNTPSNSKRRPFLEVRRSTRNCDQAGDRVASSHCSLAQSLRLRTLPVSGSRSKAEGKLTATTQDTNGKKKNIWQREMIWRYHSHSVGIVIVVLSKLLLRQKIFDELRSWYVQTGKRFKVWNESYLSSTEWECIPSQETSINFFQMFSISTPAMTLQEPIVFHTIESGNHLPNTPQWGELWQAHGPEGLGNLLQTLGQGHEERSGNKPWKCQISWLCHTMPHLPHLPWWNTLINVNVADIGNGQKMDCNWWLMLLIKWFKLVQGELLMFFLPTIKVFHNKS